MEGIKFVNLIETSPVIIEIQRVENGELAISVNNTLVCHMIFLATDTQPCVLMMYYHAVVMAIDSQCLIIFQTMGKPSVYVCDQD